MQYRQGQHAHRRRQPESRGSLAGQVIAETRRDAPRAGRLLEAEDVSFGYAGGPEVLSDVSLTVGRAENVVIQGGREVGKTTLAKVLSGELAPTWGRVHVDGRRVGAGEVSRLAFPPTDRWYEEWSPEEYLGACFSPHWSPFVARRLARDTLDAAGLIEYRRTRRDGLSHRVRAEIVALGALVDWPGWLVLDEPDFKLRDRSEVWSLTEFVFGCARACRAGLVLLTSSVLPEILSERSFAMGGRGLRTL